MQALTKPDAAERAGTNAAIESEWVRTFAALLRPSGRVLELSRSSAFQTQARGALDGPAAATDGLADVCIILNCNLEELGQAIQTATQRLAGDGIALFTTRILKAGEVAGESSEPDIVRELVENELGFRLAGKYLRGLGGPHTYVGAAIRRIEDAGQARSLLARVSAPGSHSVTEEENVSRALFRLAFGCFETADDIEALGAVSTNIMNLSVLKTISSLWSADRKKLIESQAQEQLLAAQLQELRNRNSRLEADLAAVAADNRQNLMQLTAALEEAEARSIEVRAGSGNPTESSGSSRSSPIDAPQRHSFLRRWLG